MRATARVLAAATAIFAISVSVRSAGQGPPPQLPGTATVLLLSAERSSAGTAVTLTARVAPANPGPFTPSGTVEFFDVQTSVGIATLETSPNGISAVLTMATLGAGPHILTAKYLGDANLAPSTSGPAMHLVSGQ